VTFLLRVHRIEFFQIGFNAAGYTSNDRSTLRHCLLPLRAVQSNPLAERVVVDSVRQAVFILGIETLSLYHSPAHKFVSPSRLLVRTDDKDDSAHVA